MKKLTWKKASLIFEPKSEHEWMKTHAMLPTAEQLSDGMYRIYFGSRNSQNQSHIGWFDISLDTLAINQISSRAILAPGKLGTFDDNGVLPSSVLDINGTKHMYYIGFKPGGTTRMDLFGGLAVFNKEDMLHRYSEAPIIERCRVNPYINTAPFVIASATKKPAKYFMYYVAGCGWIHKDLPKYNIQMAFSDDGIEWKREGAVCIDFKDSNEVALARPYVLFHNNKYHMWFSYKGDAYRIGYAISDDGMSWHRCDDIAGLEKSDNSAEFDSEMVAYSCIIPYNGKLFMFYNGNNYGAKGIGVAVADE